MSSWHLSSSCQGASISLHVPPTLSEASAARCLLSHHKNTWKWFSPLSSEAPPLLPSQFCSVYIEIKLTNPAELVKPGSACATSHFYLCILICLRRRNFPLPFFFKKRPFVGNFPWKKIKAHSTTLQLKTGDESLIAFPNAFCYKSLLETSSHLN